MNEVMHAHELTDELGGDKVYSYYAATLYPFAEATELIAKRLIAAGILTLPECYDNPEYQPAQEIIQEIQEINHDSKLPGLTVSVARPFGRFITKTNSLNSEHYLGYDIERKTDAKIRSGVLAVTLGAFTEPFTKTETIGLGVMLSGPMPINGHLTQGELFIPFSGNTIEIEPIAEFN